MCLACQLTSDHSSLCLGSRVQVGSGQIEQTLARIGESRSCSSLHSGLDFPFAFWRCLVTVLTRRNFSDGSLSIYPLWLPAMSPSKGTFFTLYRQHLFRTSASYRFPATSSYWISIVLPFCWQSPNCFPMPMILHLVCLRTPSKSAYLCSSQDAAVSSWFFLASPICTPDFCLPLVVSTRLKFASKEAGFSFSSLYPVTELACRLCLCVVYASFRCVHIGEKSILYLFCDVS